MIAPVVDAFKYLTQVFICILFFKLNFFSADLLSLKYWWFSLQLEYDILEYVVIERLVQGGREKLKDDGLNLSDWLQSLASFWGHLYVIFSLVPFDLLPFFYILVLMYVLFAGTQDLIFHGYYSSL